MRDVLISLLVGFPLSLVLDFVSNSFFLPGVAVGALLFGHSYLVGYSALVFNWLFYAAICFVSLRLGRRAMMAAVKKSN
jgi:membrane protein implicated in regulation of membrane protease activity